MRTELLDAFAMVAEERHFGRAADRLHIGQSPLSQQIRQLEREIGTPLFTRTTRRVELTPAGVALYDRVPGLLRDLQAAGEDARRAAAGELGRLAIGFTGSATFSVMPGLTTWLHDSLPAVTLDLHGELLTPAQIVRLADGRLDIGLLRPPVPGPRLNVEVVSSEPLLAVLPTSHPLAGLPEIQVADLAEDPFVAYPSHARSVLHEAVEQICHDHGFHPDVRLEVAETATLVAFVASGMGVSLVPAAVANLSINGAVYVPLAGGGPTVDLAVAWRRDDTNPVLARVLDLIREHMRGDVVRRRPRESAALGKDLNHGVAATAGEAPE
jgi:DNA-binding transcriptional LysR family regulator